MADIDFKQIGLAAKDILLGIGTVAAGAEGGPAAAEGVQKAGGALDRLIGIAAPSEPKPSRAEKFDRGGITPRTPAAPRGAPLPVEASSHAPVDLDAKTTEEYLTARGWTAEKVQQILRGPAAAPEPSAPLGDHKMQGAALAQAAPIKEEEKPKTEALAPKPGHVEDIIFFDKKT